MPSHPDSNTSRQHHMVAIAYAHRLGEFALLAEPSQEDLEDSQAAAPNPVEILVQVKPYSISSSRNSWLRGQGMALAVVLKATATYAASESELQESQLHCPGVFTVLSNTLPNRPCVYYTHYAIKLLLVVLGWQVSSGIA